MVGRRGTFLKNPLVLTSRPGVCSGRAGLGFRRSEARADRAEALAEAGAVRRRVGAGGPKSGNVATKAGNNWAFQSAAARISRQFAWAAADLVLLIGNGDDRRRSDWTDAGLLPSPRCRLASSIETGKSVDRQRLFCRRLSRRACRASFEVANSEPRPPPPRLRRGPPYLAKGGNSELI